MIWEPSLKANAAHSSAKYNPMRVIFLFYDHSLLYVLLVRRSTSVADVPARNLSSVSLLCALLTTAHAIFWEQQNIRAFRCNARPELRHEFKTEAHMLAHFVDILVNLECEDFTKLRFQSCFPPAGFQSHNTIKTRRHTRNVFNFRTRRKKTWTVYNNLSWTHLRIRYRNFELCTTQMKGQRSVSFFIQCY